MVIFGAVLTLALAAPLYSLMLYASGVDLHSHILLIPFVAAYLLCTKEPRPSAEFATSPLWAAAFGAAGLAALAARLTLEAPEAISVNDRHSLLAFSYVSLLVAGGFLFLGREWMKQAAFPVSILVFMVPLPDELTHWLETGSQDASALAAALFFNLAGIPHLHEGHVFKLETITLRVAQECSGIRSSFVLFITGIIAAQLFLKSPWRRLVFILLIIPLGILRNGFRILVIGWLCVEYGPHMIHSFIHRRGGPVFFLLSLIPLFIILWWLRRGETSLEEKGNNAPGSSSPTDSAIPETAS